ncbi:MAG: hypothetical protein IRY94_06075 [Rhodospirillaceae bacterium]|nr:hypothetical protein [Rhodospirillaceae bacterium]
MLALRCPAKFPGTGKPPSWPPTPLAAAMAGLGWLKKINPVRDQRNCGQVALAVDAALAGRGMLPAPPGACAGTTPVQLESLLGRKFGPLGPHANVHNAMLQAGDGARRIVLARTKTGHGLFFNIVNHQGTSSCSTAKPASR